MRTRLVFLWLCGDRALVVWDRNDRAEFAANVGGYVGAPDDGEFAFLMENHSGKGGPRYELLELLAWLEGVRKIQRFLGFAESELTYLYDIAVWGNTPVFCPFAVAVEI